MLPLLLGIGIPVFVLVTVGLSLWLGLGAMRRRIADHRGELEQEGIVRDTGRQWLTVRYNGFRAPGRRYGTAIKKGPGTLVLTRKGRLVVLGSRRGYWLAAADCQVGVIDDGVLHIQTTKPAGEGVSGSVDYRVQGVDTVAWLADLKQAGATPV